MALIQTNAANRPVFKLDGDDYAVEFNVSDDPQYLVAPVPAGLANSPTWAFAFWYMRRGDPAVDFVAPPIFMITADGGSPAVGAGINYRGDVTPRPNFHYLVSADGTTPLGWDGVPIESVPLDEWVHMTGQYTGTHYEMYLNGVFVDSFETGDGALGSLEDMSVTIGAARNGVRYTPMRASNLQIWNTSLTAQQIQQFAMVRLPKNDLPSGLVGYWPL